MRFMRQEQVSKLLGCSHLLEIAKSLVTCDAAKAVLACWTPPGCMISTLTQLGSLPKRDASEYETALRCLAFESAFDCRYRLSMRYCRQTCLLLGLLHLIAVHASGFGLRLQPILPLLIGSANRFSHPHPRFSRAVFRR